MSILTLLMALTIYPMQISLLVLSLWMAYKERFSEATYASTLAILLLLIENLP